MKNYKRCLAGLAIFALLFSSCSKEENSAAPMDPEMASLSFGAILEDFESNRTTRQALDDLPACSNDDPAYVMIILSKDGSNVVGNTQLPFRIDLATNQMFTVEVPELELTPGTYSLDYFAVHNEDGVLIWLAPTGELFSEYFDNPMPMQIELQAGVKKYVEVSVLCFDNRLVNEYGYLFFEVNAVEVIDFCIFGNYCDESGRHYPAEFSVNVWAYEDGVRGSNLHSEIVNNVEPDENGDFAGTSVCVSLPDVLGVDDEYYFEVTLLNSDAYGEVTEEVIRAGVISDWDVRELFVGDDNVDSYHFREGNCNMADTPDLF